ncbi:MATE family efflux transporter [Streptomyces sp. NPDC048411]|uniref:MATE family efflux transporter n=1 Tax=Streptomyces sp. NPDC048411 TaxID=3157206 RepID=UPI0034535F47
MLRRRRRVPGRQRNTVRTAGQILAAGAPFGVDFTARMAVGTLQLGLVASFGVTAVAGYGVGYRVLLTATMAFYAIRQAAAIEAARLAGADEHTQLPSLTSNTALSAGAVSAAFSVLCAVAAGPVTALFTSDPAVAEQSVAFLRLMGLYLPPYALVVALGGVLQATGRGRALVRATGLGFALQLPAGYALSRLTGVNGVWLAMALGAGIQPLLLKASPARLRRSRLTSGLRSRAAEHGQGSAEVASVAAEACRDALRVRSPAPNPTPSGYGSWTSPPALCAADAAGSPKSPPTDPGAGPSPTPTPASRT